MPISKVRDSNSLLSVVRYIDEDEVSIKSTFQDQLKQGLYDEYLSEPSTVITLGRVVNVLPLISKQNPRDYSQSGESRVPYPRISDIANGSIRKKNLKYLNSPDSDNCSRYFTMEGDILFSNTGTIGKVAVVNEMYASCVCDKNIYVLRPNKELVVPSYIYHVLSSPNIMKKLYRLASLKKPINGLLSKI